MKALTLTLLSMALSINLQAQSNKHLTDNKETIQYTSWAETEITEKGDPQEVQFNQPEELAYNCTPEENEQEQHGFSNSEYNKPKKKKNPNKGYSLAGEVSYNTGIGFYSGALESGLSAKHFFKGNTAVEGILTAGWRYRGIRLTALYEVQKPLGTSGFYWYWGIGGHTGVFTEEYWNTGICAEGSYEYNGQRYNCDGSRVVMGVDGIVGLEYQFAELPFTLGLGAKPSVDIIGRSNYYGDGAFSFRYVF